MVTHRNAQEFLEKKQTKGIEYKRNNWEPSDQSTFKIRRLKSVQDTCCHKDFCKKPSVKTGGKIMHWVKTIKDEEIKHF